jgi:hypothetical protein
MFALARREEASMVKITAWSLSQNPKAVPWLGQLVASLSSRRPGFALGSVLVKFVMD